jgi:hypothetical protein
MPTLLLNPLPIISAELPGHASGGDFVRGGFPVFKELL